MKSEFIKGLKDGIPIGLGYLSVSIGIGITAVAGGMTAITTLLMSMTNLTSAGEVAGISVIAAGGTLLEMALLQLVINIRYSLMGISLSQKLDNSFTTGHRLITSAFITDEIFGVASARESVNTKYFYGLAVIPYIGWALGTLIGAVAGEVLPPSVDLALGLAIYGMFVAIVLPAMKKSRGTVIAVLSAIAVSCIIYWVPVFKGIGYGFTVIIASVVSSAIAAFWRCRQ